MKLKQIGIIIIITASIIISIGIFSWVEYNNIPTKINKVKCYDNNNNEMIDLECYDEIKVYEHDYQEELFSLAPLLITWSIIFLMVGISLLFLPD